MVPIELLLGPSYSKTKQLLHKTEYASPNTHMGLQKRTLTRLLRFAGQEIPYYRKRVRHIIQEMTEENVLECLSAFPVSSKVFVRENLSELGLRHWLRAMLVCTGGSSAAPMPFYIDRFVSRQREKAFIWNQWSRVGYEPGDRIASFTGNVPRHGLYAHDPLFNKFTFSSFDLIPTCLPAIVAGLNHIRPKFLHGYPSTLSTLAKLLQNSHRSLDFNVRAVLCGSEKTEPHQRKAIEQVFETKVYTWYGHSEMCVLAGECECSQALHLYPQYGYVEYVPADVWHESGKQLHEIVATGFNNWIMPFIRYKTGDYAILKEGVCDCGRHYPLIEEVVGRLQEFIVDREGNLISVSALTSLFEKLPFIEEVYIFQDKPGQFDLCVLPQRVPSDLEREHLIDNITTVTHGRLEPAIRLVKEVPKTARGKRRVVEQHLDVNAFLQM